LPHPPPPPETSTLSLHDALPISEHAALVMERDHAAFGFDVAAAVSDAHVQLPVGAEAESVEIVPPVGLTDAEPEVQRGLLAVLRSEEHTSELQSRRDLVCRLLLE